MNRIVTKNDQSFCQIRCHYDSLCVQSHFARRGPKRKKRTGEHVGPSLLTLLASSKMSKSTFNELRTAAPDRLAVHAMQFVDAGPPGTTPSPPRASPVHCIPGRPRGLLGAYLRILDTRDGRLPRRRGHRNATIGNDDGSLACWMDVLLGSDNHSVLDVTRSQGLTSISFSTRRRKRLRLQVLDENRVPKFRQAAVCSERVPCRIGNSKRGAPFGDIGDVCTEKETWKSESRGLCTSNKFLMMQYLYAFAWIIASWERAWWGWGRSIEAQVARTRLSI